MARTSRPAIRAGVGDRPIVPGNRRGSINASAPHAAALVPHFPWNPEVHGLLGAAHYRLGDVERAYETLSRARALSAQAAEAGSRCVVSAGSGFAYLAMSCAQLERDQEAAAALEELRNWLATTDEQASALLRPLLREAEAAISRADQD